MFFFGLDVFVLSLSAQIPFFFQMHLCYAVRVFIGFDYIGFL